MADEADMAQELEELALTCALGQRKEAEKLVPKGHCYNCDEPLPPGMPFCDKACAEDWERRQAKAVRRA